MGAKVVRRKVGGDIWDNDVRRIKEAVTACNQIIIKILDIIDEHKNAHFLTPVIFYLSVTSTHLMAIMTAVGELEEIAQSYMYQERHGDTQDGHKEGF